MLDPCRSRIGCAGHIVPLCAFPNLHRGDDAPACVGRGRDRNDRIYGNSGDDTLLGQNGADSIYGQAGDDIALGGWGNDRVNGGVGLDTVAGGPGSDTLIDEAFTFVDDWVDLV